MLTTFLYVLDNLGRTPIHFAASEGHLKVCKLLRTRIYEVTLHSATKMGHGQIFEFIYRDEYSDD